MEKNALIQLPPTDSPTPKCSLDTVSEETGREIITGLPSYPYEPNATKFIWNIAKTREENYAKVLVNGKSLLILLKHKRVRPGKCSELLASLDFVHRPVF
jgi:hypothetical protein